MQRLYGWSESGNGTIQTQGVNSSNNTLLQRSFPGATVTVYVGGSNNLATIFSDNNSTPLANPFTASNSGYWDFYAAAGRYDVQFSGGGIATPFTLPDISLGAVQTINGQSGESQNFATGNSGNNFNIASSNNNHTFNLPKADNNNNGYLSAADYAAFAAKGGSLNFNAPLSATNNNVSLTTPLAIVYGGTGQNNAANAFNALTPQTTKGDLIGFNNASVAVRIPVGNNAYALVADATNNNGVKWAQVDLTAGVIGVLPIANGGSNGNNATQAFDNLSPLTTKGDLVVYANNNHNVRLPVGANNQSLIADATNNNGVKWAAVDLSGNGVTGVLPSSGGGTGGNNNAQGFDNLAPTTTNGDMIIRAANTNARLAIGANNSVLTANNNNASWVQPGYLVQKFTVAFNNNAFIVNALALDINLFTLGQYQKIAGVTAKVSALFLNNNNTITDVTVSLGISGNATLFSANYSVGNAGVVGNSNFQDTSLFKSGNMGGNQAVLAHFVAANNNFGNGVATVLTQGSVDIWVATVNLQ